jgi:predicted TPR repeat methyltransferase
MLMRGMALARLGRPEEAARCFEAHLELNPNDPTALHLFHACAGDAVPERATDDYIRAKYDNYADSYDAQQRTLSYHAPFLIAGAVDARLGEGLTVLDAGCGTGLAAMGILPHCAHLTGVDLSDGMLAQASAKGVYQTLVNSEITHYLATHPAQFDLIVSADLLGYFGSLSPFFRQACGALRAGGYLVATLEAQDEQPDGFLLQANGRYHHGESYLSTCLSEAGFEQVSVRREWQRIEGDQRLPAWLVVAKRPAP